MRGGLPAEFLVGAERQPDFVWSAEEAAWSSLNIGRATIDVHVAAGAGEREAVVCLETGERCTYAELKDSSDRLAGALVELGLRPGDRLALRYASP
ncbi:MAG TPA: AMP-binding protein, partial [Solirubrobacterales bacterium]